MRINMNVLPSVATAALLVLCGEQAFAAPMACDGLTAQSLGVTGIEIGRSAAEPKGEKSPIDHCVIAATTAKRTGADGKPYAIAFELRLPVEWNGRFVHQFNGGNDGEVKPAFGPLLGGNKNDTALARGYAVVSSDAGHDGKANPDAGLAGGARFGFDPQARSDYGYGAVGTLQPLARAMVEAYYGEPVKFAYGIGSSNGGRHAMVAASRYPDYFDGLLIGYPGFNLPKAAVQHALDVQAFKSVNDDIRQSFAPEHLALVSDAIVAACDALDGVADKLVGDVAACQQAFDISTLQCSTGQNSACLSEKQVAALKKIHDGPRNSKGEQLYSDWSWDRGIASGNWRFWKLQSPIPPWNNMPLIAVMGSASLAQIFSTPPVEIGGTPEELEKYLLAYDFDRDAPAIFATSDTFKESAMSFMTPPDVDNPMLAAFKASNGKALVFHGAGDPVFSLNDTVSWYSKLDANHGGKAGEFAMLYVVPGMPHGAGGPSTDDFDLFTPLVEWVENGKAPGEVPAKVSAENKEGMAALGALERKLCPWPMVARYKSGDSAVATSFTCEK